MVVVAVVAIARAAREAIFREAGRTAMGLADAMV
jgi:hypothetical protein